MYILQKIININTHVAIFVSGVSQS